jgi:acyl carrier protein
MHTDTSLVDEVKEVIVQALKIDGRIRDLDTSTLLFGSMPELDSMSVVELAVALEKRFGFEIDDAAFTAEIFDTVGSLAEYVRRRRTSS